MEALRDSELEILPKGEDYDDRLFQQPDIPLLEPLYFLQYPWVGVYIR
jgi:hypothetical protein